MDNPDLILAWPVAYFEEPGLLGAWQSCLGWLIKAHSQLIVESWFSYQLEDSWILIPLWSADSQANLPLVNWSDLRQFLRPSQLRPLIGYRFLTANPLLPLALARLIEQGWYRQEEAWRVQALPNLSDLDLTFYSATAYIINYLVDPRVDYHLESEMKRLASHHIALDVVSQQASLVTELAAKWSLKAQTLAELPASQTTLTRYYLSADQSSDSQDKLPSRRDLLAWWSQYSRGQIPQLTLVLNFDYNYDYSLIRLKWLLTRAYLASSSDCFACEQPLTSWQSIQLPQLGSQPHLPVRLPVWSKEHLLRLETSLTNYSINKIRVLPVNGLEVAVALRWQLAQQGLQALIFSGGPAILANPQLNLFLVVEEDLTTGRDTNWLLDYDPVAITNQLRNQLVSDPNSELGLWQLLAGVPLTQLIGVETWPQLNLPGLV